MGNIGMTVAASLKLSDKIVKLVTADLDDPTARRRSRDTEGASIAWVIGHLIHYRYQMLGLVGGTARDTFAEKFGRGSAGDGADYPSIEELVAAWHEASEEVVSAIEGAADYVFTQPVGGKDGPHGEKRVLDNVVFFMWHESYHIGQIGTLRTQFGLTATSTLATGRG